MKLQNSIIIALGNSGLLSTTEHDVPAKDAYKVYKFRKAVGKAYSDLAEREKDFPKSAGVEEGKEPTDEQLSRIQELHTEMLNDETDLGDIKTMGYESYHILANENRRTPVQIPEGDQVVTRFVDIFRVFQEALEGVLWEENE